jgi:hypothetical protein
MSIKRALVLLACLAVVPLLAYLLSANAAAQSGARWRVFNQHAPEAALQVAIGNFPGTASLHKLARNADISSGADEDLWNVGGDYVFPDDAETVQVVSTLAADDGDPAGTGAHAILVTGLDADYVLQNEVFVLNGTNAVTGTKLFLRVFSASIVTAGANGTNIGAISAVNTISGDDLFLLAAGKGLTTLGVYTVPANTTFLLTRVHGSILKKTSGAATIEFVVRPFGGAFLTLGYAGIHTNGTTWASVVYPVPVTFPEKTDIKMRASVTSANTDITGGFDGYLVRGE